MILKICKEEKLGSYVINLQGENVESVTGMKFLAGNILRAHEGV